MKTPLCSTALSEDTRFCGALEIMKETIQHISDIQWMSMQFIQLLAHEEHEGQRY